MGILDFEKFQVKDVGRQIKGNKTNSFLQFLLGGATPFGAKLWGKLLGRDFEPFVNEFGGPTDKRFDRADAAGVDTGFARDSHAVAKMIAAAYGANALGGIGTPAAQPGAAASGQALGSTAGTGSGATLGNTPGLLGGGTFPGAVGGSAAPLGNTGAVLGVGGGAGIGTGIGVGGGAAASGQAAGSTVGGGPEGFKIDGSSGNNFMDQLQQQRPNLGGQQQGGGDAMSKIQLVQLMMEIRRLQEEKDAEKRRQLGIGF